MQIDGDDGSVFSGWWLKESFSQRDLTLTICFAAGEQMYNQENLHRLFPEYILPALSGWVSSTASQVFLCKLIFFSGSVADSPWPASRSSVWLSLSACRTLRRRRDSSSVHMNLIFCTTELSHHDLSSHFKVHSSQHRGLSRSKIDSKLEETERAVAPTAAASSFSLTLQQHWIASLAEV